MTRPAESLLDLGRIPLPFCPGCGHTGLVRALDRALVSLAADPARTVIVTDIGCIGLADRSFTTSAFHGLHGRSLTYAAGLKLARPELRVVVLMGDGACGIGGAHLLSAARRNVGLTLIVANNMNYGMTGGQHSVTTPEGAVTATTPGGNPERPLDLCAVAAAAGASFVARATTFEDDLAERIADAVRRPGFSMIDVLEPCSAWYAKVNRLRRSDLAALQDRLGLRSGVIADSPRPELAERLAAAPPAAPRLRPPPIEPRRAADGAVRTGIVVAGGAGQKILSAASLFGRAAITCGLDATQKDDYPITVRTGHSVAELILSPEPIGYTGIERPDHLVVVSPDGARRVGRRLAEAGSDATVWADEDLALPETRARVVRLPFSHTARRVGRGTIAVVALAALASGTGLIPLDALLAAAAAVPGEERSAGLRRAVRAGADLPPPAEESVSSPGAPRR